jgi:bifunctional DNA-binding transcriptional regulator/antitoxin component of YhaV-PrlF toxin-antitoxin module
MTAVTVSETYRVVVFRGARLALGIRPGQRLRVLVYEGRVELISERDIREACGLLGPLDTMVPRDGDRT